MPQIIKKELISGFYDDTLAGHIGIINIQELIARNYYWPMLKANIKFYIKEYDIYLAIKLVKYKFYSHLQFLPIPIH